MNGLPLEAGVPGFEPGIFGLGGQRIIQLCYTPSLPKGHGIKTLSQHSSFRQLLRHGTKIVRVLYGPEDCDALLHHKLLALAEFQKVCALLNVNVPR